MRRKLKFKNSTNRWINKTFTKKKFNADNLKEFVKNTLIRKTQ